MGQITREFAKQIIQFVDLGKHAPLTQWEQKQLAQAWLDRASLAAENEALRRALTVAQRTLEADFHADEPLPLTDLHQASHIAQAALSTPAADHLKAHDAEVREQCAELCESLWDPVNPREIPRLKAEACYGCAAAIRAMKGHL